MKKLSIVLCAMVLLFGVVGTANASLVTIGTATYNGSDYNLIYEDDSVDGGLVWLDYTNGWDNWQNQMDWASSLNGSLTVNLLPGFTSDIDWATGWRLPLTQDHVAERGQTGSEMGHLYYISLGNDLVGSLTQTGNFINLVNNRYWSATVEGFPYEGMAWDFNYHMGGAQAFVWMDSDCYGMAVHPGTVDAVPIPSAIWLLSSVFIGLVSVRKNMNKRVVKLLLSKVSFIN